MTKAIFMCLWEPFISSYGICHQFSFPIPQIAQWNNAAANKRKAITVQELTRKHFARSWNLLMSLQVCLRTREVTCRKLQFLLSSRRRCLMTAQEDPVKQQPNQVQTTCNVQSAGSVFQGEGQKKNWWKVVCKIVDIFRVTPVADSFRSDTTKSNADTTTTELDDNTTKRKTKKKKRKDFIRRNIKVLHIDWSEKVRLLRKYKVPSEQVGVSCAVVFGSTSSTENLTPAGVGVTARFYK